MGQTNLRHSLRKRYAHLCGERDDLLLRIESVKRDMARLDELEGQVPELERLINAAELLLRDNDPEWNPEETEAIKPWTHHIPIPFGQCGRRGHVALREAQVPMTCRQVAIKLLADVDVTEPDRETLRRVQNAVEASFRKFEGRTVESSGAYPKQWRAVNKPELAFDP